MKECNIVKQSPLAGLAAYGGGSGSVIFGRKGVGGFAIERSLRFNTADSAYLNRAPSSAGDKAIWTLSFWIKICEFTLNKQVFTVYTNSTNDSVIRINGNNYLEIYNYRSGSYQTQYISDAQFRDPSAWYHFVVSANGSTSLNAWVNGEAVTWSTSSGPNGVNWLFNSSNTHQIGRYNTGANSNFYLAEVNWIDGQALAATDFGEYSDDGIWDPKKYTGSFGTNGFHLKFDDVSSDAALGTDSSGNSNTWTVNNLLSAQSNNTDGIDNVSNITQVQNNGNNQTVNLANLRTMMNTSTFQDADTDNSTYGVRVSGGKKFAVKWSNLTGLTGVSVRWQRASTYDASVQTTGTGITTTTTSLTSSRRQDTFSTSSTTGQIIFEDVTSGSTNGFFIRAIEFKGYSGNVVYPTNVENFILGSDTDSLFDSPTNGTQSDTGAGGEVSGSYCTLNPLESALTGINDGNLNSGSSGSAGWKICTSTMAVSSGKYYWEGFTDTTATSSQGWQWGFCNVTPSSLTNPYGTGKWSYQHNVVYSQSSSGTTVGTTASAKDILAYALDMDAGTCKLYVNNSLVHTFTGISGTVTPFVGSYNNPKVTVNFGARSFTYNAPSGFKTLCTTNLPTPTIADGSAYFDTKLYTGNGSSVTVSNLDFSPDFVWLKGRSDPDRHGLYDTVRGATKRLQSSETTAEDTQNGLTAFNSDGFAIGNYGETNGNGRTYVGWAWNAGANSNRTYTVKVVSDSGNKYRFDDFGTSAVTLDLAEGSTYIFDQSDSSNSGHPLRFSTTSNGTHGGGTEYTTGVTVTGTPGQAGAKTTIVVAASAPTLYYYCSVHSGMGGQANTNSTAGASNFDGSIQSTVKASQISGFSIVSYTGSGTANDSIGHGLNAAPELIICKNRDSAYGWRTLTTVIDGSLDRLFLQQTDAAVDQATANVPTSSVFYVATNLDNNKSGDDIIAYCFTSVDQYSRIGVYQGNGSSDGPFVYTGFRVAWLMIKNTSTGGETWTIYDSTRDVDNPAKQRLLPNAQDAESVGSSARFKDLLSNGFKIRGTSGEQNTNGDVYIYAAFAEYPFKTARAR